MRRTVLALLTAVALAACQQPAETPAADEAAPAATTPPEMPADAPPQEEVDPAVAAEASSTSCILDQGSDAAMALVARCMAVSPASHPPCNPENPCQLIQDEIDRACQLYGPGEKPAECSA